jgi:hypothetical protein
MSPLTFPDVPPTPRYLFTPCTFHCLCSRPPPAPSTFATLYLLQRQHSHDAPPPTREHHSSLCFTLLEQLLIEEPEGRWPWSTSTLFSSIVVVPKVSGAFPAHSVILRAILDEVKHPHCCYISACHHRRPNTRTRRGDDANNLPTLHWLCEMFTFGPLRQTRTC